jgi:tetratricopeptide (TPR) repeat protein
MNRAIGPSVADDDHLLREPVDSMNLAWEGRVRALPPADRRAAIAEADALRSGDLGSRTRASRVYMALREELFPSRAVDAARLEFLFIEDPRRTPEMEALALAAEASGPPELQRLARLVLGQCAADMGRPAEAERRLRSVLSEVRGRGGVVEAYALRSLVWLSLRQSREFEALVLARRALRLAESEGAEPAGAQARLALCSTLRALEDWPRLRAQLDLLEAQLEGAPPDAWHLRGVCHGLRADLALHEGRTGDARRHRERLASCVPPGVTAPWDPRWPGWLEAETLRLEGRLGEAVEVLRATRHLPSRLAGTRLRLLLSETLARLDSGDADGAGEAVHEALELLLHADADSVGSGLRIRYGALFGTVLRDRLGDAAGAQRAYELAGAAVLVRLGEIERALQEIPELATLDPEDLAILTEHRERVQAEHGGLLQTVSTLLDDAVRVGRRPLGGMAGPGELLAMCAWCGRVRTGASGWHPIGAWLPSGRSLRISHGICPECLRAMTPEG